MRADRLLKLAAHLECGELGHEFFDIKCWNDNVDHGRASKGCCGTSGCAIGECPIAFPDDWVFGRDSDEAGIPSLRESNSRSYGEVGHRILLDAAQFFEIPYEVASMLFTQQGPGCYNLLYDDDMQCTSRGRESRDQWTVAKEIRAYVECGDVLDAICAAHPREAPGWAEEIDRLRSEYEDLTEIPE